MGFSCKGVSTRNCKRRLNRKTITDPVCQTGATYQYFEQFIDSNGEEVEFVLFENVANFLADRISFHCGYSRLVVSISYPHD